MWHRAPRREVFEIVPLSSRVEPLPDPRTWDLTRHTSGSRVCGCFWPRSHWMSEWSWSGKFWGGHTPIGGHGSAVLSLSGQHFRGIKLSMKSHRSSSYIRLHNVYLNGEEPISISAADESLQVIHKYAIVYLFIYLGVKQHLWVEGPQAWRQTDHLQEHQVSTRALRGEADVMY